DRTGVHAGVLVRALEPLDRAVVAGQLRGADVPAQRDPLAWGQGQVPRRAHRLAVAALDAAVDFRLDRGRQLDVPQVGVRVVGEQDARVEQPARVAQPLDLAHHVVELVAVL